MEPLSWTGALGAFMNPIAAIVFGLLAVAIVLTMVQSSLRTEAASFTENGVVGAPSTPALPFIAAGILMIFAVFLGNQAIGNVLGGISENPWVGFAAAVIIGVGLLFLVSQVFPDGVGEKLLPITALLMLLIILIYTIVPLVMPYGSAGIVGEMSKRFVPVWIALFLTFVVSIKFKRKLGLYGKLFDSTIGMIGFALVMFWVFTAFFVGVFDLIMTHDPLSQVSGLKNKVPGVPVPEGTVGLTDHYLLGGDNLARDIFSRVVAGSVDVIVIAPFATIFAFMVGITLGLPAGFYGGRLDTVLSFIANLVLAFPVILLFYLLVTPEIVLTGIPSYMAAVLFIFPIIFFWVLLNSRYHTQPAKRLPIMGVVIGILVWLYLSLINQEGTKINFLPEWFDLFDLDILVVFVSVVFVNSPTVFRIVRGLALDLRTRDYVAAAQTRGEGPWYVMLWEILPNARGPLIVDFCLRIGYTTILLGTLGFFGLGLSSESPDWGSTINEGRKLLLIFVHPAIPPAVALLTLVLGLNLLADGLREESLRD